MVSRGGSPQSILGGTPLSSREADARRGEVGDRMLLVGTWPGVHEPLSEKMAAWGLRAVGGGHGETGVPGTGWEEARSALFLAFCPRALPLSQGGTAGSPQGGTAGSPLREECAGRHRCGPE